MAYRKIDMAAYPRRAHFDYFCAMAYPYVGLTADVDVTELRAVAKARGWKFFLACVYAATAAANAIPAFRQRVVEGEIVEYDLCCPSQTLPLDDGTYCYCLLDASLPPERFMADSVLRQQQAKAAASLEEGADPLSLYFFTCVPWMAYTAIVQPVPQPADSNPRITFGGVYERDGRLMMPLSVLAHHALVDGRQIAEFYDRFQEIAHAL